jgi:Flp pilus assembly protein TadG
VRRQRGNTLTEFALILPFMLAGIFGVIEFGRALYTYHFVSYAAREASRWASVRGRSSQVNGSVATTPAEVEDYVTSITPAGIDRNPARLLVDTEWVAPPGRGNNCGKYPKNPGCSVQVTVIYNFKFILPFMPSSTYAMKSTSEMVISQ